MLPRPGFDAEFVPLGVGHDDVAAVPLEHRRAEPRESATGPGARRSKWTRFFAVLTSGTFANQTFGPPQPAASTNALSLVESSSTSEPKTAAQKVASRTASAASNVTDLITLGMLTWPLAGSAARLRRGRRVSPRSRR